MKKRLKSTIHGSIQPLYFFIIMNYTFIIMNYFYYCTRVFNPNKSNESVKRKVWSSGFDCDVEIT